MEGFEYGTQELRKGKNRMTRAEALRRREEGQSKDKILGFRQPSLWVQARKTDEVSPEGVALSAGRRMPSIRLLGLPTLFPKESICKATGRKHFYSAVARCL